jgi:predicted TIM-barrel fold metal-dependent hydrolase
MPPDPNTRTPDFKMPPKACDAHCHVFGPGDKFPYAPERSYTPPDAPREKLKELHGILGVKRVVLVQASCHGIDNSAMLDSIAHNKDDYRGVCMASDEYPDDEFERLHEGGVRAVRFNFVQHLGGTPDLDNMKKVVDRVKPLGWHLVIHVDAQDLIKFEDAYLRWDTSKAVSDPAQVHGARRFLGKNLWRGTDISGRTALL